MSNEALIFLEADVLLASVAEDVARAVGGTARALKEDVFEVMLADGFYTARRNRKVMPEYDAFRYAINVFGPQDPDELSERTMHLARRLAELRPEAHLVALDANYDPIWTWPCHADS